MKLRSLWSWRNAYSSLLITGITAAMLLNPIQVNASDDANNGGVRGNGDSTGSTVTGDVKPGDPLVSAFGDAWEVTLYVQSTTGCAAY